MLINSPKLHSILHKIITDILSSVYDKSCYECIIDIAENNIINICVKFENSSNTIKYDTATLISKSIDIHISCTSHIKSLSQVQKNNELWQRIEILTFKSNIELEAHLDSQKKIHQGNNTALFTKLGLGYILSESPGFITWSHRGLQILQRIKKIIRSELQNDYQEIITPSMMKKSLWKKSGHLDKFGDNMFIFDDLCSKPMNCPGHASYLKTYLKHYPETKLPLRLSEFGKCLRNEASGALDGLKRLREFTQDDGHIFCFSEHIDNELDKFMQAVNRIYRKFGFKEIAIKFSTRPEQYVGNIDTWNNIEAIMKTFLDKRGYDDVEILEGEGAFYGPKIEIHIKGNNNKLWQCGTIQVDMNLSERLNLKYKSQHPVILHRAILGSIERFLGILLEQQGRIPYILVPHDYIATIIIDKSLLDNQNVQDIINLTSYINDDYDMPLHKRLKSVFKNRYTSYVVIIGSEEINTNTVVLRHRKGQETITVENFKLKMMQYQDNIHDN